MIGSNLLYKRTLVSRIKIKNKLKMICKNLLTLAFLFITASAIKLTLKEDEPQEITIPCEQVCPMCTEDPCPPCTSTCDDPAPPAPPAEMESPANITIHLTSVGGQPVDDTILIDRIVHRPTELPPNTVVLPGDEVVDFDVHVYDKNGEP